NLRINIIVMPTAAEASPTDEKAFVGFHCIQPNLHRCYVDRIGGIANDRNNTFFSVTSVSLWLISKANLRLSADCCLPLTRRD
ncbi:hypothetical protein, partial [Methylophaga lonarensis]|uniref:hypothetical protein n=1 Tax=Methylophaga lonarensis TaxID=999151 RepID=UPI003D2990E4